MSSAKGGSFWVAVIQHPTSKYAFTGPISSSKNPLGEIAFAINPREITTSPFPDHAGYFFIDENGNISEQNLETQSNGRDSSFNTIDFDSSGNIYACGYRADTVADSSRRPYLVKYSAAGVKQWERTLDNPAPFRSSHPGFARHATDSDGNSYVGYYAFHTEDFDSRFFMTKINTSGAFVLTREHDSSTRSTSQSGNSVRVGLNLAGDSFSFVQDSGTGNPVEVFVKKDSNGTQQFTRRSPTVVNGVNAISAATGFDFDVSGNIYVAGRFQRSGAPSGFTFSFGRLAKFNSAGTIQWQVQLGNLTTQASAEFQTADVAVDGDGSLYFVGASVYDGGSLKGIFAKYNASGVLQFQRQLSSATTTIQFTCVEIDQNGDVVVGGRYGNLGIAAKLPPDGSGEGTYGDFTYGASTLESATTTFTYGTFAVGLSTITTGVTSRSDISVDPELTANVTNL